jgi:hypothetical protein
MYPFLAFAVTSFLDEEEVPMPNTTTEAQGRIIVIAAVILVIGMILGGVGLFGAHNPPSIPPGFQ